MNRIPQLDSLRGIAVCLVLIQHLGGIFAFGPGHRGVELFFVLSGFLITGILLRTAERRDAVTELWTFVLRRASRIFPLYYFVVILFAAILNIKHGRDALGWLLLYGENFKIALANAEPPIWSVFWTLAIEEHFYLLWPALILFATKHTRLTVTVLLICIAPAWRILMVTFAPAYNVALYKLDFACVDSLALGALLAQSNHWQEVRGIGEKVLNWILLPAAIFATVALTALVYFGINWTFEIAFGDVAMGIIFCAAINKASTGFHGVTGTILNAGALRFIGRISYGIYVYHLLCLYALNRLCVIAEFPERQSDFITLLLVAPVTVFISWLSWRFLESPAMEFVRSYLNHKTAAATCAATIGST